MFILFSLIIIAALCWATASLEITNLGKLEGLKFHEYGDIKIIKEMRYIPFYLNVTSINSAINKQREDLKKMQTDCTKCNKIEIDMYLANLSAVNEEFKHIVGWTETLSRRKRFLDPLEFFASFGTGPDKTDKIIKNAVEISISNLWKANVADFKRGINEKSRSVNYILKMFRDKKLHKDVIPTRELQRALDEIKKNLTENEVMPFESVLEFYDLPIMIHDQLVNRSLKLFLMDVPIIEKNRRSLEKVIQIPTRSSNGSFIRTNINIKFVAVSTGSLMLFENLDFCHDPLNVPICRPQQEIKRHNSTSCIVNAYQSGKIDERLCHDQIKSFKTSAIEFEEFVDNNQDFWFYTPEKTDITENCKNTTKNFTLFDSGIIKIDSGCTVHVNLRILGQPEVNAFDGKIESITRNVEHEERIHEERMNIHDDLSDPLDSIISAQIKGMIFFFLILLIALACLYVWCCRRKPIRIAVNVETLPRNVSSKSPPR